MTVSRPRVLERPVDARPSPIGRESGRGAARCRNARRHGVRVRWAARLAVLVLTAAAVTGGLPPLPASGVAAAGGCPVGGAGQIQIGDGILLDQGTPDSPYPQIITEPTQRGDFTLNDNGPYTVGTVLTDSMWIDGGGSNPTAWTWVKGTLPAGTHLSYNIPRSLTPFPTQPQVGYLYLYGQLSQPGTYCFTIQVVAWDSQGESVVGQMNFRVQVVPAGTVPPPAPCSAPGPAGQVTIGDSMTFDGPPNNANYSMNANGPYGAGQPLLDTLYVAGGSSSPTPPLTWTIGGDVPPGLIGPTTVESVTSSISVGGGEFLTGSWPNAPGAYCFWVRVTGRYGTTGTLTFNVTVVPQPAPPQSPPPPPDPTAPLCPAPGPQSTPSNQLPGVSTVQPASGSAGTVVTIDGYYLAGASAVTFGTAPATWFEVVNSGEICAVAPTGPNGATEPVLVTTPAGTTPTSWQWTRADGYVETTQEPGFTYGQGLSVASTALPDATAGQSYSQQLRASGGVPPYTWSMQQTCVQYCDHYSNVALGESPTYGPIPLPPGLTLDPQSGTISGTPTQAQSEANLYVQVSDQGNNTVDAMVQFKIDAATGNPPSPAPQPAPAPQPSPAPNGPPTGAFSPTSASPGANVTLSGAANPGTFMSVYLYCGGCGANGTHVGVAQVGGDGSYALSFPVPAGAQPGSAYVQAGCDTCGNSWSTFSGLTIVASSQPSPAPTPTPATSGGVPTGSFDPTSAAPGQSVTLSGTALPGSFVSAYLYCTGCNPAGAHVGVAQVGSDGSYSLSFPIPAGAQPGPATLSAGCDSCGNPWQSFAGLTITAATPRAPVPAGTQGSGGTGQSGGAAGTTMQPQEASGPTPPQPSSQPVVTAVKPGAGPDSGGATVTLTGSNLGGATSVSFGDFGQAQIDQIAPDGTSMQVTTPQAWWGDGPVYVQVTTPLGSSTVTPADQYAYQAGPASQPGSGSGGPSSGAGGGASSSTTVGPSSGSSPGPSSGPSAGSSSPGSNAGAPMGITPAGVPVNCDSPSLTPFDKQVDGCP